MTASLVGVAEVDLSDLVVTEEHIEHPVCGGWSQRQRIAAQGLTDVKDASTEVQRAVVLCLAYDIAWGVLDVGDLLREGARAPKPPRRRCRGWVLRISTLPSKSASEMSLGSPQVRRTLGLGLPTLES